MRWDGQIAGIRVNRNVYKILILCPECKKVFGKHEYIWGDNIKMDVN
jgi:hypothetical protein